MGAFGSTYWEMVDEAMHERWLCEDIESFGVVDYSVWDY